MLAANLAGDRDWRLRHPRTEAWFARHPRLDRAVWLAGIELRSELPDLGAVRIAIERDPLEALKLGTYVGTCLGRGGGHVYSAAAVALDVNKHVVYARDARGAVVGRQLVALSEADELVCFRAYAPTLLEPLFAAFDRQLAAELRVPVYARTDASYEIASILSHDWWDDGAWVPD
jgi:hypothetical protein